MGVRVGFVPASRTIFDQNLALKVRDSVMSAMSDSGLEPVTPGNDLTKNGLVQTIEDARKTADLFREQKVKGVLIGALNFGNEIPAAIAAVGADSDLPIMIFGIGEEGVLSRDKSRRDSFCGLISIATALRHRKAKFVFPRRAICFPEDPVFRAALEQFGDVCRALDSIRGAVYGQIGPRPADFETCAFDEISLIRNFGISVVPVPLTTLFSRAAYVPEKRIREVYADMEKTLDRSRVSDYDLSRMARIEVALEELIEEYGLSGLAIQCWTSFQDDYGISPCLVMARLTDRGIPCACEADVHGTLSMHLMSELSENPAALADWNNRHVSLDNCFSAWHCGVFPPSLSSGGKRIGLHDILAESTGRSEGKYGTIQLRLDNGPVTMARITEFKPDDFRVLVAEGEVIEATGEPPGSHGWVEVLDLDTLYAEILRGFPHHVALGRGHFGGSVVVASYFLGINAVAPLPLREGAIECGATY